MGRSIRPAQLVAACAITAIAAVGLDRGVSVDQLTGQATRIVATDGPAHPAPLAATQSSSVDLESFVHPDALRAVKAAGGQGSSGVAAPGDEGVTRPPTVAPPTPSVAPPRLDTDDAWQDHGLVAHAFGATLDRTTYTNSEEAIRLSHGYGFRVFEVDMMLLKDKRVALVHDSFEGRYGLSREKTFSGYTQAELEGKRFDGKYPMLFGDDLIRLMNVFPDSHVILDTKGEHVEIARWFVRHMKPAMLDRLRPHVHSQEQIDGLRALYDWKGMVIATYKMGSGIQAKALELAMVNGINTVMIRGSDYSDAMRKELSAHGVKYLFIHDAKNEAEARRWRSMGLGVYSHYWTWTS